MKLRLSILLLAAALAASPAAGQTIKSLGFNTTNGSIVYSGTNDLRFPATIRIGTNQSGFVSGGQFLTLTDAAGGVAMIIGTNAITSYDPIAFSSTGNAATTRTNLGLGATNAVTFSNITASGTLAVTGNVTMSGVNNTAPSQTNASSASSLMTRDLVGQEFANPRNRMQTTYWFGLEGLGQWGAVGQNATTSYLSARESSGVGGGQLIYSAAGIGVSAAGAGLRLGSADPYGALGIFTIAGSGDTTFKARLLKNTQAGLGPAMAFVMGTRTATTIWQNNAPGIYYVPQPTNAWASNAVVTNNYRIAVSNVVFAVSTAGTNDATQPAWPDAINAVVTNGSAVYRNVGPHTSNNWVLAIGSTNASQVAMTNTGKVGPTSTARASYVLTFRVNGTTNVFAKVETGTANGNAASESAEVSLGAPATTSDFQPQVWSRDDVAGGGSVDPAVRYISVDGPLGNLQ